MALQGATGVPSSSSRSVPELTVDEAISREVLNVRRPVIHYGAPHCEPTPGQDAGVCVSMLVGTHVLGALSLAHPSPMPDVQHRLSWLGSMTNFVATLIERRPAEQHRLDCCEVALAQLDHQLARAQA